MATGLAVPCADDWISPDNRAVAHFEGSKSPPRPRIVAGPWLKVSQKAGALKLQFADATNVDGVRAEDAKAEQLALVPPFEPLQLQV